jgi:hypothetical protein
MGATPQLPRAVTDLVGWMKGIESQISLLHERMNNPLANTGLTVPGAGTTQVDGNFHVATGNLLVDGSTTINGPLVLPNASVDDAWLVKPVIPGVVNLYVSFFGLPIYPTFSEIAGVDLTVPAGCTQLQFTGTGSLDCYNSKTTGGNNGAGGDYMYPQVRIGSSTSPGNWATGVSGSNGNATATRSYSQLLTGLTPGSTVRASVYGSSDYGISSVSGNLGSLSAQLTWLH